jgi:hypothetical protein
MNPRHHRSAAVTHTKFAIFISMKLKGGRLGWIFPAPIP